MSGGKKTKTKAAKKGPAGGRGAAKDAAPAKQQKGKGKAKAKAAGAGGKKGKKAAKE